MVDEHYGQHPDEHPGAHAGERGAASGWDEARGTFEGRAFPNEAEWLSLPAPPVADDFVARTLAALQQDRAAEPAAASEPAAADAGGGVAGHLLTPDLLRHFAPPEPTADFVARTLRAVQDDRRTRWRELLARHVAPEPTPEFVARTLRALADDRPGPTTVRRAGRWSLGRWSAARWLPPLLLAAATVAALVLLQARPAAPLEQRLAAAARPSSALAYAATPLAAVFGAAAEAAEPRALSSAGADGMWLLLHRRGR